MNNSQTYLNDREGFTLCLDGGDLMICREKSCKFSTMQAETSQKLTLA